MKISWNRLGLATLVAAATAWTVGCGGFAASPSVSLGEGVIGKAASSGESFFADTVARREPAPFLEPLAVIPLQIKGHSVGALVIMRMLHGKRQFSGIAKELLKKVIRVALSADPQYRSQSKAVEAYFTNNVEDILRARRIAAGIVTGADPGLTLEGFRTRYSPNGAPDGIVGYD